MKLPDHGRPIQTPRPERRATTTREAGLLAMVETKSALLNQAENVCYHLLPNGKRHGSEWCCGSLRGEPGRSLAINLSTGLWCDFATGESGSNLLELWRQVHGTDFPTALRESSSFCGLIPPAANLHAADAARKRAQWPALAIGSQRDLMAVANLRGIAPEGIEIASKRGLLWFADWHGRPCWIITDRSRMNAQARRMDGQSFAVNGASRKALTFPGSRAGMPIGLDEAKAFPNVAVVEGGPDSLAAHACIWAEDREDDVAVVAVLGASNRPSAAVWAPLAGKRVRVYCHHDDAGMAAARAWAEAIVKAGCADIDGFRFDGMRQVDGSDVTDLNDLFALHPDDFEVRRDTWVVLP